METDNFSDDYTDDDQLKKYASDLVKVYKSEKEKRKKLETANKQLEKYAGDLNKSVSELKTVHEGLKKDPFPVEVALEIIKKEQGQHFDPDVVDVFLENIDEILKIKSEVDSAEDTSLSGFARSERDRAGKALCASGLYDY